MDGWYHSDKGYCWASVGVHDVNFYSAHFFQRYAERHLNKEMSTQDAAREFYRGYQISSARNLEEIASGIYKIQLPIHDGLALGFNDISKNIVVYNTYVSRDMLGASRLMTSKTTGH